MDEDKCLCKRVFQGGHKKTRCQMLDDSDGIATQAYARDRRCHRGEQAAEQR